MLRTRRRLLPTLALLVFALVPVFAALGSDADVLARVGWIVLAFALFEGVHLAIVCFGMQDVRLRLRRLRLTFPEHVIQPLLVSKGTVANLMAADLRNEGADFGAIDTRYVTLTTGQTALTLWIGDDSLVKLKEFRAGDIERIEYVLVDLPMHRQLAIQLRMSGGQHFQFWAGSRMLWGYPTARDSGQRALFRLLRDWIERGAVLASPPPSHPPLK